MTKNRTVLKAPSATVSSPVRSSVTLPGVMWAGMRTIPLPPLDARYVAKWRRWKQAINKGIKKALATNWPNSLKRDWNLGALVGWGFLQEELGFPFIHHFALEWTPDTIAVQCSLEPEELWRCWKFARCFTPEMVDQLVEAGVSQRRIRDLMRLLWAEGCFGRLARELKQVLPRTRETDALATLERWIDIKLQEHRPPPLHKQIVSKKWSSRSFDAECYLRKFRQSPSRRSR